MLLYRPQLLVWGNGEQCSLSTVDRKATGGGGVVRDKAMNEQEIAKRLTELDQEIKERLTLLEQQMAKLLSEKSVDLSAMAIQIARQIRSQHMSATGSSQRSRVHPFESRLSLDQSAGQSDPSQTDIAQDR